MSITEEMKADSRYGNYFRVVREMLAEARAWRAAGGVSYVRPVREFSGCEDYDLRKTMEYWK